MDYDPRDFERGKQYGDLTVAFESKAPHDTWWISIHHIVGEPPKDLVDDLNDVGWRLDTLGVPPLAGREESIICRDGTGIFGGWTGDERGKFMADAFTALEKHGIIDVPLVSLTLQDLL